MPFWLSLVDQDVMAVFEPDLGMGSGHALAGILEHDVVLGVAADANGCG